MKTLCGLIFEIMGEDFDISQVLKRQENFDKKKREIFVPKKFVQKFVKWGGVETFIYESLKKVPNQFFWLIVKSRIFGRRNYEELRILYLKYI